MKDESAQADATVQKTNAHQQTRTNGSFLSSGVLVLLVCGAIFVPLLFVGARHFVVSGTDEYTSQAYAADLNTLADVEQSFSAISVFFKEIAEEKGGVYAFELLKRAELPSNIDVHLIGHLIGDELYKQEGLGGMRFCTHDFRNACSHSVVIGALLADGLGVFDRVHEVCKEAPGGSGAYTMCFHGFGHGVLAYAEYEMPDAVDLCKKTGTEAYNFREYKECVGGTVMEMLSGVHDPDVWVHKSEEYLSDTDPIKLCQSGYMPDEVRPICYTYITPEIFKVAGINLGNPDAASFAEAFSYCGRVSGEENIRACYGGFGKEFVVLAQERDVRDVGSASDDNLRKIISWCDQSGTSIGASACLHDALNSLYWGGENPYEGAIRFCALIKEDELQDACFDNQIANVFNYVEDRSYREAFCAALPELHRDACTNELRN